MMALKTSNLLLRTFSTTSRSLFTHSTLPKSNGQFKRKSVLAPWDCSFGVSNVVFVARNYSAKSLADEVMKSK